MADSATTSHVTNQREAFITFTPMHDIPVAGVGNVQTCAKGRGTIILESTYKGFRHNLRLQDTLYIPTNQNNLLSLGRWERDGRTCILGNGTLTLIERDGEHIAIGTKTQNNLYIMKLTTHYPKKNMQPTAKSCRFANAANAPSWETWHWRFGHISYSGLQQLLDMNLVTGFDVDESSPKPDCPACTKAKQSEELYRSVSKRATKPGEFTHMDLWGKYEIKSINGRRYYILFVDDYSRHISVRFLKAKSEAAQQVKDYIAHLKAYGKSPRAIRSDRGKEFANDSLRTWCDEQGIEMQLTGPYSPAQNGVAERTDRTLVELARAMLTASNLPEFLWEHAVSMRHIYEIYRTPG